MAARPDHRAHTYHPPAPTTSETRNKPQALAMAVVTYHKKGNLVDFVHPKQTASSNLLPPEWGQLAYFALPDGAHLKESDSSFFTLPNPKDLDSTLFGVSVTKKVPTSSIKQPPKDSEAEILKAICVIITQPIFGLAQEKLSSVVNCFFAQASLENYDLLIELFNNFNFSFTNTSLSSDDFYFGLPLQNLVLKFKKDLITLMKLMILNQKILISMPNGQCSAFAVSLYSLLPGSLSHHSEDLHIKTQRQKYGMPLFTISSSWYPLLPYIPLTSHELLKQNFAHISGISSHQLEKTPNAIIVNGETGEISIKNKDLAKAVQPTSADLRFIEQIVQQVEISKSKAAENPDLGSFAFEGSSGFIRKELENYAYSFVSNCMAVSDISKEKPTDYKNLNHFGLKFFEQWASTECFRQWQQAIKNLTQPPLIPHPGASDKGTPSKDKEKKTKKRAASPDRLETRGQNEEATSSGGHKSLIKSASFQVKTGLGFFSIGRKKGEGLGENHKKTKSCCTDFGDFCEQNETWRDTMEDEHEMIDKFGEDGVGYFAVYDGHAGRKTVEFVKEKLSQTILKNKSTAKTWSNTIAQSFAEVDSELLPLCSETKPKPDRSGCTATVGILVNNGSERSLTIGNIGDSAAYLVSSVSHPEPNQPALKAVRITADHNARTNKEEVERIKKEGGVVFGKKVGGQLSVTRAFGNAHLKSCGVIVSPEVQEVKLTNQEVYLIIACDGLWDVCDAEKLAEIISEHKKAPPTGLAQVLGQYALDHRSKDNISVLVVVL